MKVIFTINEEVTHVRYDLKRDVTQITTRLEARGHGVCKVAYRREEYNEFEFDGKEDFRSKFKPCVEPELLRFLGVLREATSKSSRR